MSQSRGMNHRGDAPHSVGEGRIRRSQITSIDLPTSAGDVPWTAQCHDNLVSARSQMQGYRSPDETRRTADQNR
jgi:hypothetical protein